MAGELSALMSDAARQVTVMNAMALEYIADAFATPEESSVFSASFDEMQRTFAAHGHGADLRECTDPFCMQAKLAIMESLSTIMAEQQGGPNVG